MSLRSESDEGYGSSALALLERWYHVPALAAIMAVMLWIRLLPYGRFVRDGRVLFSGNDAWYHLREVNYTVRNWPGTMPFDPWTYFPYGTSTGQFGTLYDQIVATVALVLGLGNPSETLVAQVLLVAPAVGGALAAIPVYLVGKRLGGRLAGVFGATILMLLPGTFLARSLVGAADHNGVEPFFQTIAVFALLVAFAVAEREKPVWELVVDEDLDGLRNPLRWAALAGVATGAYMWVWPPGVLLVGLTGAFLVVKMASDTVHGDSPEPIAFAGAVSMGVAGALMLVPLQTFGFSATQFSLLQPAFAFAVAGGCVFMAWLAREWEARDLSTSLYPVAVFGLIAASLAAIAVALPEVAGLLQRNFLGTLGFNAGAQTRTIAEAQPFLDPGSLQQRGLDATGMLVSEYGLTIFSGVAAVTWLVAKPLVRDGGSERLGYVGAGIAVVALVFLAPGALRAVADPLDAALGGFPVTGQLVGMFVISALILGATLLSRYRAEHLFVLSWAAFITAAAFTQVRFNYYLAPVVAVMNAFLLGEVLRILDLRRSATAAVENIEGYQVLVVAAVVLLILAPALVVPVDVRNTGTPQYDRSATALNVAAGHAPGDIANWDDSLAWLANETPAEGTYGGADNEMGYYDRYERTDDFDYPDGAYGVMSWWDYGHWITVQGERIPNANPFQQGATEAANFLLAPSEERSERVLESQSTEGNQTRYVMVDWQMVSPDQKFTAPVVFYDDEQLSSGDFFDYVYDESNRGYSPILLANDQRYYDSTMVRLYQYHGSAMDPAPFVIDWDERTVPTRGGGETTIKVTPQEGETVKTFDNMSAAREYVESDGDAQIGGVGPYPEERVPAMEHYRLVDASDASAYDDSGYQQVALATAQATGIPPELLTKTSPSWVKTFERVPGATLEGTGAEPNSEVRATAQMRMPDGSTFEYAQYAETDENGDFTMTLPYSTTGYGEFGPENGYSNVSVRATGPYQVVSEPTTADGERVVYNGTVDVSEGKVVGEDGSPARVELERTPADELNGEPADGEEPVPGEDDGQNGNDSSSENETDGNESAADSDTDDNDTESGNGSDGSEQTNDVGAASLAEPRPALVASAVRY
ncbi:oligosaccharyl transferase, archaeosortase A system-associated [Halegenticoccus tardaugens]|uniref:oligosaccharyl transferase, archaeosortase A system-associated n=1 Tax=Halegenticoccus tardaugens TaxID=2071624 RepID=UPI00100A9EAB|nr:oligosaccharyl transferase, archaeosortase A system-associated [Halegenticoccus tardaugens]